MVLVPQITATLPGCCRGRNVERRFQVDVASSDTGFFRSPSTPVVSRTEFGPRREFVRRCLMTQIDAHLRDDCDRAQPINARDLHQQRDLTVIWRNFHRYPLLEQGDIALKGIETTER